MQRRFERPTAHVYVLGVGALLSKRTEILLPKNNRLAFELSVQLLLLR